LRPAPLSLHDALPIFGGETAGGVPGGVDVDEVDEEHLGGVGAEDVGGDGGVEAAEAVLAVPADLVGVAVDVLAAPRRGGLAQHRSEEHTSELQSRENL